MVHLTIVAPIYNEEKNIEEFTNRVLNVIQNLTSDYQIIFVDDGSTDNSWGKIQELCLQNIKFTGIKFSRNFGHHYAITAGLNNSNSEWVVVMDTDLQDRPEVIPELYKKAKMGFDIVFVNRINRTDSRIYKVLQKTFYFILKLFSGINFNSKQANFSIINKKVVNAFNQFPEQARFYGSTILWLGFSRSSIDADHGSRFMGRPSYSFRKRLKLAGDIILAFSDRPLVFTVYSGLLLSFVSLTVTFIFGFKILIENYILNDLFLILISFFIIGGIQITVLGVLGIYISKIFSQVKSRPLYLIDKTIN